MSLVDRVSGALAGKISRRSFVVRSAFAGSAVAAAGVSYVAKPGTAYGSICSCAGYNCNCNDTCCIGYTEFCCVLDGGYNSCPENTVMGGWWRAEGSIYCDGPRYYMDCNATCHCTTGCGDGYQFCDPGCDGLTCGCALGSCDNFRAGCFQFRYGQCNQDVTCLGRIHCRVVTCVPPWEIDKTCTTTVAEDDNTANQNASCLTPGPTYPPPPCPSPSTNCEVVGMAMSTNSKGYGMVTKTGKYLAYGNEANRGSITWQLSTPITSVAGCSLGGYWMVNGGGKVINFGPAKWYGDRFKASNDGSIVDIAAHPSGKGYWLLTSKGEVFGFGAAKAYGGGSKGGYPSPFVGIAATPNGEGYWITTSMGRVLAFGTARLHGNLLGKKLQSPVIRMVSLPTDPQGYWLATSYGGVWCFGSAPHYGSPADGKREWPFVDMQRTTDGKGYLLLTTAGQVYAYGDAHNYGDPA